MNQKRLLTENGQAAIWYAQGRYPLSFTAADLASHQGLSHRGATNILNHLVRGGFLEGAGGRYNWKKAGLTEP